MSLFPSSGKDISPEMISSMWSTLNDLAENNPEMYKNFINQTMNSYVKEEGITPTPCYVITLSLHKRLEFSKENRPGDFFCELVINFLTHEKIPSESGNSVKDIFPFSLGSRRELIIKEKKKVYYDCVCSPSRLIPKASIPPKIIENNFFAAVLTETIREEQMHQKTTLLPGSLPSIGNGKYLGDSKVRTHLIKLFNAPSSSPTAAPSSSVPSAPVRAPALPLPTPSGSSLLYAEDHEEKPSSTQKYMPSLVRNLCPINDPPATESTPLLPPLIPLTPKNPNFFIEEIDPITRRPL